MKKIIILFFLVFLSGCRDETDNKNAMNTGNPRYVLHKTENIFTILLLDTRTGKLWQTQYALDGKHFEGAVPISEISLADEKGVNGRFSLSSTGNIFTFILVDNLTGSMRHCQFSLEDKKEYRGCYEIVSPRE